MSSVSRGDEWGNLLMKIQMELVWKLPAVSVVDLV